MNKNLKKINKKWEKLPMDSSFSTKVPKVPGIYLVVINNTYLGIPIEISVKYVGRALKSLRSRFLSHNSEFNSHNRDLLKLIRNNDKVEFWFQRLKIDQNEIESIERELIRDLKTYYSLTNKIKYKKNKEE